jgi:hypothetical protein
VSDVSLDFSGSAASRPEHFPDAGAQDVGSDSGSL